MNEPKLNIVILYGGKTGEHQVSRVSAGSVIRNIDRSRYKLLLVGIDEEGVWHLQDETELEKVIAGSDPEIQPGNEVNAMPGRGLGVNGKLLKIDLVFPVLHGTFGEDGTVQGFLEMIGLPYAGAGVLASAFGMDKVKAKELWRKEGLSVVPFIRYSRQDHEAQEVTPEVLFTRWSSELGAPFFVKPCRAGSSVGISKVRRPEQLAQALDTAFHFDNDLLIETSINAREIECSVLGNREIRSFPPGEVISSHDFYDYSGKYLDPKGARLEIPADLSPASTQRIRNMAEEAFKALGGQGLARVDFFVDRDSGSIFINEVNTMPGFTSISMYPKMCEAGGLSYRELLNELIRLGLERHSERSRLDLHYGEE
ncbi:D-alanine--D-alanine ligase family protein [Salinispira pacifica]|uniref:D-alanine--D-alanine ligase n=1 Tax=Salinispira pacifica TaxID=1307761 RepID=V5WGM7_9SPIO|nr:D-alanine--D-alanine ligase family protein [Salinispira pacifica]AHC14982.1 D-alanine--D-alanine ligase [Salinispira pacifica]